MSDIEKDEAEFAHTGDIPNLPPKDDVKTNKAIADETDRVNRARIQEKVRISMGEQPAEPKPVGTMTRDCPQLIFRLAAKVIGCKQFELDDAEAQTMATQLNVLIPLSGKMAAFVVVMMITLNKVFICYDAIMRKFRKEPAEAKEAVAKPEELPEPLS